MNLAFEISINVQLTIKDTPMPRHAPTINEIV